jgi:hypothetical protein
MDVELQKKLLNIIEMALKGGTLPDVDAPPRVVSSVIRDVLKSLALRDLPRELRMLSQHTREQEPVYQAVLAFMGEDLVVKDGLPELTHAADQDEFVAFLQVNFWPYVIHFPNRRRGPA